jgi:hypothetical protein
MLRLIGGLYPRTNCLETAHHVAHGAAGFGSPVCLVLLHGAAQPKVSKLGGQPTRRIAADQDVARILQEQVLTQEGATVSLSMTCHMHMLYSFTCLIHDIQAPGQIYT